MERIYNDFDLLEQGKTPVFTPKDRLKRLEERMTKVLASEEDLNLPYVILGMQMEKALYYGMGREEHWHRGVQDIYRDRIASMLDENREASLVSSVANVAQAIDEKKEQLEIHLTEADISYTTSTSWARTRCGTTFELRYVGVEAAIEQTRDRLSQLINVHELPILIHMQDVYRLMVETTRYVLAAIDEKPRPDRPTRSELPEDMAEFQPLSEIRKRALERHFERIQAAHREAKKYNEGQTQLRHHEEARYGGLCP